jgi:hypothetical protein
MEHLVHNHQEIKHLTVKTETRTEDTLIKFNFLVIEDQFIHKNENDWDKQIETLKKHPSSKTFPIFNNESLMNKSKDDFLKERWQKIPKKLKFTSRVAQDQQNYSSKIVDEKIKKIKDDIYKSALDSQKPFNLQNYLEEREDDFGILGITGDLNKIESEEIVNDSPLDQTILEEIS